MFEPPAPIARITGHLAEVDRRWAQVVEEVVASGEQVTAASGLSMAVWLAGVSRLPKAERTAVLVAADVLPTLPGVRARFLAGQVAWPVVARICGRASRLSTDEVAVVDERMAAAIDQLSGDCTADAILDVLWELLAQLRAARERERERRLERGEFVALQPFLDGSGGSLYGELGAVDFATVADAIIDASPATALQANPHGDARVTAANRQSLGRARAAGLVALCSGEGGGGALGDGIGRAAGPRRSSPRSRWRPCWGCSEPPATF